MMNGLIKAIRIQRRRLTSGFTLLELLVVIVIIAILFAIAAPGWSTLMNRQRVNSVRDQAAQVIRQAQADARRTKIAKVVVFDPNPTGTPRFSVQSQPLDPATQQTADVLPPAEIAKITNWQSFGNGDISAGVLELLTSPTAAKNQIVFNSIGAVDDVSVKKAVSDAIFSVNVRQKNTSSATNRCLIVRSLLGSIQYTEGTDCPT